MKKKQTKLTAKIVSLLLTAAMLLTSQGVPALAETAGEAASAESARDTREMPKNPVHTCTKKDDGTDTTAWSYVYFGSYPQTEVTGDALTAAITGASYDANGDAWVNGMKYRRMKKSDANYSSSNSGYFPWNGENDYHYFKWERIKWRVLNVNNSTMFVMADRGLDCKDYHDPGGSITWETCTLRNWLNNDFYGTAFSSNEQGAIVEQTVVNEDNPYYTTEGGNDTRDKVYLLSLSEVMNPDYGFCEDRSTYSVSRRVKASDYAHARGAWVNTNTDYAGNCWWWLRSPGLHTHYAATVDTFGYVGRNGTDVEYYHDACVPALHINLSSDLWSVEDDGTSGEGGNGGSGGGQVSLFQIDASKTAYAGKEMTVSGTLNLAEDAEASASVLDSEINAIAWTSSDPGIIDTSEIRCSGIHAMDKRSAMLMVSATPKKAATVTITGMAANGLTADCEITVLESEEPEDTVIKHVTGTLQSADLNTMQVMIDQNIYDVTETFSMSGAYDILNGDGCKTVAAVLANGKVSQMAAVTDLVEPKAEIFLSSGRLVYENGSFDKEKLKITMTLSCGAKAPYYDSDLAGTQAEHLSVSFTDYTLELPEHLYFGKASAKQSEYTAKVSDTVAFGKEKSYNHEFYVDGDYIPPQANQTFTVRGTATALGQAGHVRTAKLVVGNLDLSGAKASDKYANSTEGQLAAQAAELLGKLKIGIGDDGTLRKAGLDDAQIAAIKDVIGLWVGNVMTVDILTKDTSQDSGWAAVWEAAGISDAEKQKFLGKIAEKAFQKIGLDVSPISGAGSYLNIQNAEAHTEIRLQSRENKRKYYAVSVKLNMGTYAFTSEKAFSGYGSLSYTVTDPDGKVYDSVFQQGAVTYTDIETFSECVQAIGTKAIRRVYDKCVGDNMNKAKEYCRKVIHENSEADELAGALTSDAANKILEKKFGTLSDNVWTILCKELGKKKTEVSVKCPVDIYIYDSEGNLCGSVIQDEIYDAKEDIFLYTEGHEKYITLSGCDYNIVFVGNGTGTMEYMVEEWMGDELLRTLSYSDIPLSPDKTYRGMIPYVQMQDAVVYNPVSEDDMAKIPPSSDINHVEQTEAEALLKAKEESKGMLDTYKNASDYRQAQQKELAEAIAAGKAAIDAAADEEAVNNALAAAKVAIDKIKTDAQLTEEEKGSGNEEEKPDPSKITPKPTSIKGKIKAKKKAFLVTWKKQKSATGYQVQYATNKKFTKKTTKVKTVNGASKTKLTVKKLKAGKKYYVRVRTVQKVNGAPYYSKWSKAKAVKIRK